MYLIHEKISLHKSEQRKNTFATLEHHNKGPQNNGNENTLESRANPTSEKK